MRKIIIKYFVPLLILVASCSYNEYTTEISTWEEEYNILEKGSIIVLTDYSSTDYYIYRGQPLGYQYEMLQNMANYLGVKLDVRVSRSLEESFEMLQSGEVDLIAQNLTITGERRKTVDFTIPHVKSKQVLVQRKAHTTLQSADKFNSTSMVVSPSDLGGKTVYVTKGSAYAQRLHHLGEEIGDTIYVMEVDESVEKLIHLVSEGEISYTVCDEVFAVANSTYYPDLDMATVISLEQNLAWAVRKGSGGFVDEINLWMSAFLNSARYKNIYARYFSASKPSGMVESDYYAINSGKISPYDTYIREYSSIAGWDWRLLTSLIYQESRFRTDAVSWAGAFGIMQFMPATAGQYGISPESSPDEQILAGVKFISWLDNRYKEIEDNNERIKFILAAYNIGPGHIDDARRLAGKNGADPDVWDNSVDNFLLAKSDPVFYNDPVVKHGYCRGTETFQYVSAVMERYSHYKNVVGE